MRFEGVCQLFFWSKPPEGRGNGKMYSLVEGALAPNASTPVVELELQAVTPSPLLERMLPYLQQVAASAFEASLLPRITGFSKRVVVEETRPRNRTAQSGEDDWQSTARRAGWMPRSEAELEGFAGDMVRRAGDFARERAVGAATKTVSNVTNAVGAAKEKKAQASQAAKEAAGAAFAGLSQRWGKLRKSNTATPGALGSASANANDSGPADDEML
jgi:hypothetical protein